MALAVRRDGTDFGCGLQLSGTGGRDWVGADPVPKLPRGAEKCYAPEVGFDPGRGSTGVESRDAYQVFGAAVLWIATLGSCAPEAPTTLPPSPTYVRVSLNEFRFAYRKPTVPGRAVFRVGNEGRQNHEVRLVRLPEDFPCLQERLSAPSPGRIVVDTVTLPPPLKPKEETMFAADLRPGRYGLLCFLTDTDGNSHASKGMKSEFRVGGRG